MLYEVFITPGLIGMILLFNAMQSSLSMVYDRETGAMRTLLVSPFPRSFLLLSKLIGGVAVALLQVYVFLLVAYFWEIRAAADRESSCSRLDLRLLGASSSCRSVIDSSRAAHQPSRLHHGLPRSSSPA